MQEALGNHLKHQKTNNKNQDKLVQFQLSELDDVFHSDVFSPEALIAILKRWYPETYNQDAGVSEGYTLEEHTLMVMKQFEKYYGDKTLPAEVDKNKFRLILALHDIGKPEAISRGNKLLQHKCTILIIKKLFSILGIDEKHTYIALQLISGDPIGKYLKSSLNKIQTRKIVEEMSNKAKIPANEFFKLLCIYYKVDAGSYTENAGGFKSLDYLFNFDEVKHELGFASDIQMKIDQLGFNKE
ncbi:MAG: hypothetical protein ACOYO1_00740 [Bacteroidales bacterium]